uniref:TLC domain-containing protein n=2 Tax=Hemiselmis andersenii TaxID=464988 RepID=A0A6U4XZR0_HEMAN|mmetsp:Transcript_24836/g.57570  ORF Transcript_24836/g.57570 Transcript_24836/m.57570 type:complete len:259 (+) Transcript_24836:223-999(+)
MWSLPVSQHFSVLPVGLSVVVWLVCYIIGGWLLSFSRRFQSFHKGAQHQGRTTIPSYCFILVVVPLSVYTLATDEELAASRQLGSTPLSRIIINMATGYFLFDSLSVLLHMGSHGGQYLLHGVLCLITYGLAALFDVYHYWGPTFLLFEITTLFINARWWFAQLDNKEGTAYTINGISLILTWLSVRVIFGLSQSWVFWQDAFSPASAKVPAAIFAWYAFSNISLNLLNIFWFFKIMKSALGFFGVGKGKGKGKGKDS